MEEDLKEFRILYNSLKETSKTASIPLKMLDKLNFLGKKILKQNVKIQDYVNVQQDQLANLNVLDYQTKIKLFVSVARCLLGQEQLDYVANRQIYIKQSNDPNASWKLSYMTNDSKNFYLSRNSEKQVYPIERLKISKNWKMRDGKYSFKIKYENNEYFVGTQSEQICGQLHNKVKQLKNSIKNQKKGEKSNYNTDYLSMSEGQNQPNRTDNQLNTVTDNFDINELEDQLSYKIQQHGEKYRILTHLEKKSVFKIFITVQDLKTQDVIEFYVREKQWNPQIIESHIVNKIDQNMYIFYEKFKNYNFASWPRDFIFMKYAFKHKNNYYLGEKSITHKQYPITKSAVRGEIINKLTGFIKNKNFLVMITRVQIDFKGYNSEQDNRNMTLRYLKLYAKFLNYCHQKSLIQLHQKLFNFNRIPLHTFSNKNEEDFDLPSPTKLLQKRNSNVTQDVQSYYQGIQKKQDFQSYLDLQNQFINLLPSYLQDNMNEKILVAIQLNKHHSHNIDHKYSFNRKSDVGKSYSGKNEEDYVFQQGDWVRTKQNQMIFVNQAAIDSQSDAIKWMFRQIGANLFKGKSIMNMSLPVDIFDSRSALERSLASFGYTPILFTKAGQINDQVEQMKYACIFVISLILLELRIQKPFNPILGQTFQGYIAGIPYYAEQISHHPPITYIYAKTAQYQFYGNLDSHAELGINSAYAVNYGKLCVKFFNTGLTYEMFYPACQVSGLLYGDRKFKIVQKAFVVCYEKSLICQISLGKDKKQLYPATTQKTTSHVFGGIFKVTKQFLDTFSKQKKKAKMYGLNVKDVLKNISKLSGAWNQTIIFDNKVYHELYNPLPYKLEYELYPLASNSNYRADIIYKRLGNLALAQSFKQKSQQLQRRDRKLRQKKIK